MKNNWKKTIDAINAERYTIPAGWDTRDQVAASLECAPDKVLDLLKPGITSGEIERKEFSVWNPSRRMAEKVVCYKIVETTGNMDDIDEKLARAIRANPKKSNSDIAGNYKGTRAADVERVRKAICA